MSLIDKYKEYLAEDRRDDDDPEMAGMPGRQKVYADNGEHAGYIYPQYNSARHGGGINSWVGSPHGNKHDIKAGNLPEKAFDVGETREEHRRAIQDAIAHTKHTYQGTWRSSRER